ncbi:DUF533 domain-containing protein [Gymnodinialimonas sp. 2305UL16-5]|uniref:DUF533 domain-containing protein n=1 Tax=Gymnodinialimonas mytili TaxID=3126503 RepID=UPI0030A4D499
MSLLRTLAAVAVGVAATKGAQALSDRSRERGGGGLLDEMRGRGGADLGALLGGNRTRGGGLGDLLEEFGGSGALGGLGGMLGRGAAGGLLGGLLGGGSGQTPAFGRRLNEALRNGREPDDVPTADEEAMAGLMIRAMIMAAKADGRIDGAERQALLGRLGDLDARERQFVEAEMAAQIDPYDFARDVPDHPGLRAQIFAAAMSAIDVDSAAERRFAEDLAAALGVDERARGHVQRRMSGHYGAEPDAPWEKQANDDPYTRPIASGGGKGVGSTVIGGGRH